MARRPAVDAKPKTTLPTDWRADGYWKIIAMINKIGPGDYNGEARRFATHHIQAGTVSDDWRGEFRSWCRTKSAMPQPRCAFCGKEVIDDGRVVRINPASAESSPEFRWFCSVMHQANWETNQPRRRPRLFE